MNKEDSLIDDERLFMLRHQRNKLGARITELDTWLATVGREAKTKQDRRVKGQFITEKMDLQMQATVIREQMQEITRRRTQDELKATMVNTKLTEGISISDHALVRWLERKHGIDVEEIREAIRRDVERAWTIGRIEPSVTGKGIRATAGELVYICTTDGKVVMTCYNLVEHDPLNN